MLRRKGWRPSLPDFRDYHIDEHPEASKLMSTNLTATIPPTCIDLRSYVPWINDQGDLGSCTANAGQSLMAFMNNVAYGSLVKISKGSRLYLYFVTRYLMNQYKVVRGDSGADLRNVLGALTLFGLPPEKAWPYDIAKFDTEPPARIDSIADDFQALKYFRHDTVEVPTTKVLQSVKNRLMSKIPTMFGFTCYTSIEGADNGMIPFPVAGEAVDGGHAVLTVGYNDNLQIGKYTGALLIQNSWGTSWGEKGFGWLPYQYVLAGLATDFWSVMSTSYIETGQFGF